MNERLARHYGVAGVHGPQFRRVKLDDPARFGLLGKGAVLLRTSYGDRTSPVLRGAWVLDKLMGTPPTPPPPNVVVEPHAESRREAEDAARAARAASHRRRLQRLPQRDRPVRPRARELHRHRAVARRWTARRTSRSTRGRRSSSGKPVNGPVALRNALLARPDQFAQAVTEKLMMYAIGRKLAYHDMTQVRAIVQDAAKHEYRFAELVHGVVRSDAFREQAPPACRNGGAQTVARVEAK